MNYKVIEKIGEKNESDANRSVATIMAITFGLFTLIYILNVLGIFIIYDLAMSIAYFSSAVLLLAPIAMNKIFGRSTRWLKYAYVIFSVIFILIVTTTLTYHVVLVYAYPIAIAGVYFQKKITRLATVLTMIATVCGQLFGFWLQWRPDYNFKSMYELITYSIVPKFITLLCFSFLLNFLTKRTSRLLYDDMERYEQLLKYNKKMIYNFATLVESRDENTGGHIKRTSIYAQLLARELMQEGAYKELLNDDYINCLALVAPLHDIGKISIPDSILQKPGRLTDEEYSVMKTHSEKGGKIINDTFSEADDEEYKRMAYDVAMYHHEKWNGSGYPMGKKGREIPLSARIMAIADVFDAVSEKRCYRDAMPIDECFKIIADGKDRDFDPVLVDAFMKIRGKIVDVRNNDIHSSEKTA